ncbi:MAG: hypothetical protein AB8G22_05385 [Saprospiraceae bacterium]
MSNWKVLIILFFPVFLFTFSCENQTAESTENTEPIVVGNPAAAGFNAAASDAKAIELADAVMAANGGRAAWDNTRHLRWTFFGRRDLWWDKTTGNVRIESAGDSTTYLLNVKEDTGKIMRGGVEMTEPDSIKKYAERGKSIWINDSYWLVFPFKLKDSGVTLKYMGRDTTDGVNLGDVLQLTFENVGDTPENRYLAYVSPQGMISQWDFYGNATDTIARFSTPWLDYQTYGGIKLSSDRGMAKLSNIAVYDELAAAVYDDFSWEEK